MSFKNWILITIMFFALLGYCEMQGSMVWAGNETEDPASIENMAYPLPDIPSFVLLPFQDMVDDSDLDFLSGSITGTISYALSNMPNVFVISWYSIPSYKGKNVTSKQVAEELGVQYVIRGSIKKSGEKITVNAKMIDALTGRQVWSEQYDRDFKDILEIQDEITHNIAKNAGIKYDKIKTGERPGAGTENLNAYLKSEEALIRSRKLTPENNEKIKKLYYDAIALDSNYISPHIGLVYTYGREARFGFSESPEKSREQALKMAQKAIEIDDSSASAHACLGRVYYDLKQHNESVSEYNKAIAINPNEADAYNAGWALCYSGRAKEAIPYFEKKKRLDPKSPWAYLGLGHTRLFQGQYEEAIPYLKKALEMNPRYFRMNLDLAACYAALGKQEEAKAAAAQVLKASPNFSIDRFINKGLPIESTDIVKPYIDALRKIPFPET